MNPDRERQLWILDVLHGLGGMLFESDINDYPFDWNKGGPGHIPGTPHHGQYGQILQAFSIMGGLALVGQDAAEEIEDGRTVFVDEMAFWEEYAYPVPVAEVRPRTRP